MIQDRGRGRTRATGWGAVQTSLFLALLFSTTSALSFDGYDLAARHSLILDPTASPVLGNGEVGMTLIPTPTELQFLTGSVVGEHWLVPTSTSELTARAVLAEIEIDIAPLDSSRPQLPSFLAGSRYRMHDNALTNTFIAGDAVLSATLAIEPTRNLFVLSGQSNFPVRLKATLRIPETGMEHSPILESTRTTAAEGDYLILAQSLPWQESFGVGLVLQGGNVTAATAERGWTAELHDVQRWRILLQISPLVEPLPLLNTTLAEARVAAASSESLLRQNRTEGWQRFWARSIVDCSGSSSAEAETLEKLWVHLHHGLATHAAGGFPPADSGVGPLRSGGRFWNSTLWPIYRAWVQTDHTDDIRCLGYPLFLTPSSEPTDTSPILASESGAYGHASANLEGLMNALSDTGLVTDSASWNEQGRLFSTLPLILSTPPYRNDTRNQAAAIYPFLMQNADRAAAALVAMASGETDQELVPHLVLAVESAFRIAESIQIDPRKRSEWKAILDGLPESPIDELARIPLDDERLTLRNVLSDIADRGMSPEGLVRNQRGKPSVLATGMALNRLVSLLIREQDGRIELLPGIPVTGAWTLHLEDFTLLSGFRLVSLNVRNGVFGFFLIRSHEGGTLSLKMPPGWSSAQVAEMGEEQRMVTVTLDKTTGTDSDSTGTVRFETRAGQDYLVGPVW